MKDIKIIKPFWSVTVSRYPKIQFPIVIYYKIKRLKKKKYLETSNWLTESVSRVLAVDIKYPGFESWIVQRL